MLALKITSRVLLPIAPELIEVLPGIKARVVAIVEHELHGVLAHLFDCADGNVLLAEHQHFLTGTVAFHFRRRRMDAQVLERQLEVGAIVEGHAQYARAAAKLDFDRYGIGHGNVKYTGDDTMVQCTKRGGPTVTIPNATLYLHTLPHRGPPHRRGTECTLQILRIPTTFTRSWIASGPAPPTLMSLNTFD